MTGKAGITLERKGLLHKLCFIITSRNVQPLLGKDSCDKFNLINQVNIIQNMDKNILSAYGELFKGIECLLGRVHIKRAQDTVPVIKACRKILFAMYNLTELREEELFTK